MNVFRFLQLESSRDRLVSAETYLGQFRHPGVRVSLRSGPRGSWTILQLTREEFEAVVQAYLRHAAARDLLERQ